MNLTSYGFNCTDVTGCPICFPTVFTSTIFLIDLPGTAEDNLTSAGNPSSSRKWRRIVPFSLNAGLLLTNITFAGPEILRVSIDGVFSSLLPAGNVRVGKGFLSLHAYFVVKVFVVSEVDVIW